MIPAVLDLRLVRDRDGRWYLSIEGRRVRAGEGDRPSTALASGAKALDGITWASKRPESVEASDPASPLFATTPAGELAAMLRVRSPKDAA